MVILRMEIWYVFCACLIVILERFWPLSGKSILYGVSAGNIQAGPLEYGRWILLFLPVFLENGFQLENMLARRTITLHRYGSMRKWWRKLFITQFFSDFSFNVILGCFAGAAGGVEFYSFFQAMAVFFFHSLMLNSLCLLFRIGGMNGLTAAFLVILFEGLDILLLQTDLMTVLFPWRWGMWNYIRVSGNHFWGIVSAEAGIVLAVCFYAVYSRRCLEEL